MLTNAPHYRDFPLVKRPESEADYSYPSSAEVKNEWICASPPPACLHVLDRDNFTSPLYIVYLGGKIVLYYENNTKYINTRFL